MTFENAVKKIREKFEELDASKLADMAVQVTLTDEDCGGTLYFKVDGGTVDVQGYDYRDNDVILDIERKALMDIISGKSTLDKAVEKGQATAKGDYGRLESIKDAVAAKPVAKKTAVKKPVAKKSVPAVKKEAKAETAKKSAAKKSAAVEKKEVKVEAAAKKTTAKATAAKKEEPAKKTAAKTTKKK